MRLPLLLQLLGECSDVLLQLGAVAWLLRLRKEGGYQVQVRQDQAGGCQLLPTATTDLCSGGRTPLARALQRTEVEDEVLTLLQLNSN